MSSILPNICHAGVINRLVGRHPGEWQEGRVSSKTTAFAGAPYASSEPRLLRFRSSGFRVDIVDIII